MSFFDMGPLEILLILLIALIVWGPGKIPEAARMLGRAVSTLRKFSFDLTTQVKNELAAEDREKQDRSTGSSEDKTEETSVTPEVESDDENVPDRKNE